MAHKPLGKVLDYKNVYVTQVAVDRSPIWLYTWGTTTAIQSIHAKLAGHKQVNIQVDELSLPWMLPEKDKIIFKSRFRKQWDKTEAVFIDPHFNLKEKQDFYYLFYTDEAQFIQLLGTVLKQYLEISIFPNWFALIYNHVLTHPRKEVKNLLTSIKYVKGLPEVRKIQLDIPIWTEFIQELIRYKVLELPIYA